MAFNKCDIRLAAFDLDGTIFDRGTLLPETREAIMRLHESGVETIVATGRHPFYLPEAVMAIPCFRYAVASNGGMVADIRTREVLSVVEMDVPTAKAVAAAMLRLSDQIHIVHRGHGVITRSDMEEIKNSYTEPARREQAERDLLRMYRIAETAEGLIAGIAEPVIKCGVRFSDPERVHAGAEKLRAELDCEVVITDSNMVEVTPRGVSKATGLEKLSAHLGLSPENAVAFGDSGNDVDIMTRAAYSVAMGNATEDVKAAASYVTDTVQNAGVAKAIKALWGI